MSTATYTSVNGTREPLLDTMLLTLPIGHACTRVHAKDHFRPTWPIHVPCTILREHGPHGMQSGRHNFCCIPCQLIMLVIAHKNLLVMR